jgi:hypothetical protein
MSTIDDFPADQQACGHAVSGNPADSEREVDAWGYVPCHPSDTRRTPRSPTVGILSFLRSLAVPVAVGPADVTRSSA